jgi:hypothetical protein
MNRPQIKHRPEQQLLQKQKTARRISRCYRFAALGDWSSIKERSANHAVPVGRHSLKPTRGPSWTSVWLALVVKSTEA